MNTRIIIRPAVRENLEAIIRLRTESILATEQHNYSREQSRAWAGVPFSQHLESQILDGGVLVGLAGRRLVSCISLDLDDSAISGLFVTPAHQRQGIGRRMVTEAERLAIRFGMTHLKVDALTPSVGFFRACNYRPGPGASTCQSPGAGLEALPMAREFPRRQTRYGNRIRRLLQGIGIPADYGRRHRLTLQPECRELANIGTDARGREQFMKPEAAMAWYAMRNAARAEGVGLQVVSAYRSVGYQVNIIERKRQAGQGLDEILSVSAAPGYSEHHSGKALDLGCPDAPPLEEQFEATPAFEWLMDSALEYGFSLSFPRNNRHGIGYEPWHWAWRG